MVATVANPYWKIERTRIATFYFYRYFDMTTTTTVVVVRVIYEQITLNAGTGHTARQV